MKHIVCYSGGHSSALVAIEVTRKFGKENVILLNHDISSSVESQDIKRFKQEVADFLGIEITFANIEDMEINSIPDQFDLAMQHETFKFKNGLELCTTFLKTVPFKNYLENNFSDKNCIIYYGFDANEKVRIQRRTGIIGAMGYRTDYPLALWSERTIYSTKEIGIEPPMTYESFKHANCIGCLKAGKQHWYIVYCTRKDIWEKAKRAEDEIGFSIIKDFPLYELEELFEKMQKAGVNPTEHVIHQTFWKNAKNAVKELENSDIDMDAKPCECVF